VIPANDETTAANPRATAASAKPTANAADAIANEPRARLAEPFGTANDVDSPSNDADFIAHVFDETAAASGRVPRHPSATPHRQVVASQLGAAQNRKDPFHHHEV